MPQTIDNQALGDDARDFWIGPLNIPTPTDGLELSLDMKAAFEYDIIDVYYLAVAGGCSFQLLNQGSAVIMDDSDSLGVVPVGSPSVSTTSPTATEAIPVGNKLTVLVDDTTSDIDQFEIQLKCRRTKT